MPPTSSTRFSGSSSRARNREVTPDERLLRAYLEHKLNDEEEAPQIWISLAQELARDELDIYNEMERLRNQYKHDVRLRTTPGDTDQSEIRLSEEEAKLMRLIILIEAGCVTRRPARPGPADGRDANSRRREEGESSQDLIVEERQTPGSSTSRLHPAYPVNVPPTRASERSVSAGPGHAQQSSSETFLEVLRREEAEGVQTRASTRRRRQRQMLPVSVTSPWRKNPNRSP